MIAPGAKKCKVITRKDGPQPIRTVDEKGREHLTLLLGISAAGKSLPNLLILPLKTLPELDEDLERTFKIAGSAKGWMTSDIFQNMLMNFYVPAIDTLRRELNAEDAVALINYDGASTHLNINTEKLKTDHHIIINMLEPHSSALMQPLDLNPNGVLKHFINEHFDCSKEESTSEFRKRLLHTVKDGLSIALASFNIKVGWERSGLWPIDRNIPLGSNMVRDKSAGASIAVSKKRKRGTKIDEGRIVDKGEVMLSPAVISSSTETIEPEAALHNKILKVDFVSETHIKISRSK